MQTNLRSLLIRSPGADHSAPRADQIAERIGLVVVLLAMLLAFSIGLNKRIDRVFFDVGSRLLRDVRPVDIRTDVVVVGIDEPFLRSVNEPIALSHPYLGQFLGAMAIAKPKVVGLDLVLPTKSYRHITVLPSTTDNIDQKLLRGLISARKNTQIVLGVAWQSEELEFSKIFVDFLAAAGGQTASLMTCPDPDGVIRRLPDRNCQPQGNTPLYEAMASIASDKNESGEYVNFSIGGPFAYIPIGNVLLDLERNNIKSLKDIFADKIVLLGAVLPYEDRVALPVMLEAGGRSSARTPGVFLHAQALRTVLNQRTIVELHWAIELILSGLAACLWFRPTSRTAILAFAGGAGILLVLAVGLLNQHLLLSVGSPLIVGATFTIFRALVQAWRTFKEKRLLRRVFGGSVSPSVLDEILSGKLSPDLSAKRGHICVLFADIRGFTTRSENLQPEAVFVMLNRYFQRLTVAIHKHQGTIDKFIGDGIMAFFGAPKHIDVPELHAYLAAREMLRELGNLNQELVAEGLDPIRIGIGLHSGDAVTGYLGSDEKREYTAIGDTVNAASRLEGLTKDAGCELVVSARVAKALDYPGELADLGEFKVKGRAPLQIFGLREQK